MSCNRRSAGPPTRSACCSPWQPSPSCPGAGTYDDLSATWRGGPTYIPTPLDTASSPYRNAHGHNRAQYDGVKSLCPVALGCISNTHTNSMGPGAIAGGTSCTQSNPRWHRCWIPSRAWCHRWSWVSHGTQAPRSGPRRPACTQAPRSGPPRPAWRRKRHQWPPWLRLRQSHLGPEVADPHTRWSEVADPHTCW